MTALAKQIEPVAPPQSAPVTEPLYVCPVRHKCLLPILGKNTAYRCGFELVGTVLACHKRKRMEGEG